jgi:hypothetical protein
MPRKPTIVEETSHSGKDLSTFRRLSSDVRHNYVKPSSEAIQVAYYFHPKTPPIPVASPKGDIDKSYAFRFTR